VSTIQDFIHETIPGQKSHVNMGQVLDDYELRMFET